eukprot:6756778-Pyramimonas_sp.AAC.1
MVRGQYQGELDALLQRWPADLGFVDGNERSGAIPSPAVSTAGPRSEEDATGKALHNLPLAHQLAAAARFPAKGMGALSRPRKARIIISVTSAPSSA